MNLLLDTHVWLWSHLDPERLSRRAREALLDEENRLWLSPISLWEFLVLVERKRIVLRSMPSAAEWIEAALSRAPMQDAPLTRDVALRSRAVRLEHDDPADRFLVATADVFELTLVTSDEKLLQAQGCRTLSSR